MSKIREIFKKVGITLVIAIILTIALTYLTILILEGA